MKTIPVYHEFLVNGHSMAEGKEKIKRFFDHYELISYSELFYLDKAILNGKQSAFWERLASSEEVNRRLLRDWIQEMKGTGVKNLEDLEMLPQGYPSKLFHTIAHVLDGFFGVDSHFFNLIEDSHWVSQRLKELIKKSPDSYWLITVEVTLAYGFQGFEKKAPRNIES
ncbi:hypothetical protein DBT_0285 [Dissulfuribacter thermophilus]|uniref:Uncharacterized protein n=1 Tax=Dissulfuribacter thermophilus TaxID=1156395 RepID=A0A1B9F983_9BACT|nr:hypothetical protein [Dissulfuribacter thermophilus]OCC16468.1 hypothetical protein DBT_0285 [Dissulfuribacter thermophilus]